MGPRGLGKPAMHASLNTVQTVPLAARDCGQLRPHLTILLVTKSEVLECFGLLCLPSCLASYLAFPNDPSPPSQPSLPFHTHSPHSQPAVTHYPLMVQQPPHLLSLGLFWLWPLTQTAKALEFPQGEGLIDIQSLPLSGFHLVSNHFSQEPSTPMKLFNQQLLRHTLLNHASTPLYGSANLYTFLLPPHQSKYCQ